MKRLGMALVPPHGIHFAVYAGGLCLSASYYVPPWALDNPESTDITKLEVKAFNGDGLDAGLHEASDDRMMYNGTRVHVPAWRNYA